MNRVLIVDDNQDISETIKMLLTRYNLDARINTTGFNVDEDVLEYNPDIILMDISLPGKLGNQICRELKEVHKMPIILISAFNKDDELLRDCGADGFIQKPFHLKDLLKIIDFYLVPMEQNLTQNSATSVVLSGTK